MIIASSFFCVLTEIVEFFFVDTTPFADKYFTEPEDEVYDWRDVLPRENYISNLLKVIKNLCCNLFFVIDRDPPKM